MTAGLRQDVGSASLSATANAMANMRTTRDELAAEDRTNKRNHAHVTLELASVRDELEKLRANLKADRATLATYASNCAPIVRMHELNLAELKRVYNQARDGHTRAVEVIKKEFSVRPRGMRKNRPPPPQQAVITHPHPPPAVSNPRGGQEVPAALRKSAERSGRRNADCAGNGAVG